METIISGNTLDLYLSDIKNIFENYDFNKLKNIIFLSTDSFLGFFDDTTKGTTGKSLKEIMETIEPFIPLVINNDNLYSYLFTAVNDDGDELEKLQKQFIQNSKIKFVKNIIGAKTDGDLEEIFEICRTIRDYKEKSIIMV